MPLIEKERKIEKSDLRVKISGSVKSEIEAYCRWAEIDDISHFFSEAAKTVFTRDRDWQKVRQDLMKQREAEEVY